MADPSNLLTIIGTITSQVALITAVLYYFGWVYAHGYLGYFGVDPVMAGYGTADYVLRSIKVAFLPFIYAASAALALFGFHRAVVAPVLIEVTSGPFPPTNFAVGTSLVVPRVARPTPSRRILGRRMPGPSGIRRFIGVLQVVAIAVIAGVFLMVLYPGLIAGVFPQLVLPLLLVISVTVLGYVAHVRSIHHDVLATVSSRPPLSRMYILSLLALGLVAGLWALSLYGDQVGTSRAAEMANQLPEGSGVVIYSTERIALHGPGIIVAEITQPGTKYHYQYSGLWMLAHSTDRFLLLPSGWQHGRDRVFLLRDNDSVRVDIEVR